MRRLAALLALLVVVIPSAAAKPSFVIVRDVSIGGFARDALVGKAVAIFGEPTGSNEFGYDRCTLRWRHLGMTMETTYQAAAAPGPCGDRARMLSTTVTDRRWRTKNGLRIGDRSGKLRRLFPKAVHQGRGEWWLIRRPFAGEQLPGLAARVANRRIVSLTVYGPRIAF